jgi:hypothetical protein
LLRHIWAYPRAFRHTGGVALEESMTLRIDRLAILVGAFSIGFGHFAMAQTVKLPPAAETPAQTATPSQIDRNAQQAIQDKAKNEKAKADDTGDSKPGK